MKRLFKMIGSDCCNIIKKKALEICYFNIWKVNIKNINRELLFHADSVKFLEYINCIDLLMGSSILLEIGEYYAPGEEIWNYLY